MCLTIVFSVQDGIVDDVTNLLKDLYDSTKSVEKKSDQDNDDALPELIVKDFDEEQIWQELELQNAARFKQLSNTIKKFKKDDLLLLDRLNGDFFFFLLFMNCHIVLVRNSIAEFRQPSCSIISQLKLFKTRIDFQFFFYDFF